MQKILIIEDDLIDQMAFTRMLEQQNMGYQSTIANSIKEAKKALSQNNFDLVISDHNLADGTTFDLIHDIHDTPFILISGNEDQLTINSVVNKINALTCFTKDLDLKYLQELPKVIKKIFNNEKIISNCKKIEFTDELLTNQIESKNVSINLKTAMKIFDGKKNEVKETIELFIFHKPREMEELYNYLNAHNCEKVIKTAHLVKSGFRIFGMKKQIELADYIEKNVGSHEKGCTCDEVYNSFKQLSTDTKIAIELLKKELPLL